MTKKANQKAKGNAAEVAAEKARIAAEKAEREEAVATEKSIVLTLDAADDDSRGVSELTAADAVTVIIHSYKAERAVVNVAGYVLKVGRQFQREALEATEEPVSDAACIKDAVSRFAAWATSAESTVKTEAAERWLGDHNYPIRRNKAGDGIVLPGAWTQGKHATLKMLKAGLIIVEGMTKYSALKATESPRGNAGTSTTKPADDTPMGRLAIACAAIQQIAAGMEKTPGEQSAFVRDILEAMNEVRKGWETPEADTDSAPEKGKEAAAA